MGVRWLLGTVVLLTVFSHVRLESQRVVCYYTNWSVYRQGLGKYTPQNINPYLCTHLIYAFGGITNDFILRPFDKYQDIDKGGYAKFNGLKSFNKNLKTLLAIGGWTEGSKRFSFLVADAEARANFTRAAVRYLRQHNFDGLDLDWEYPASREGSAPEDKRNYVLLVQELRQVFEKEAASGSKQRLLLTMAVPAGLEYADRGYDVPALNKALDFINLLTYDYHVATEAVVNHHAPLRNPDGDSEFDINAELNIEATVNYYLKNGADPSKLVLGIPTYGRAFKLFNPEDVSIGAPADGAADAGKMTREAGYLAYYEICEKIGVDSWEVEKPYPNDVGPFAYKNSQWVGYDDEDMVTRKAEYVLEKRLGGIMFWAIDNDDFRGLCTGKAYPLIEAGKAALFKNPGNSASVGSSRPNSKATTRRPSSVISNSKLRPSGTRATTTSRPAATPRTTTVSSFDSTPEWQTPEPPVTPDNGVEFTCKDEGFFPHPRDCKRYFWCLDSGALGIVSHAFTCPSGLHFNKFTDSCDYATNVNCRLASASSAAATTLKPFLQQSTTLKTTTRPPTTRSTTTTTTTTEPPPEEEEDYSEEGKDYLLEEDNLPEDPNNLQQLLQLIEDLGGVDAVKRMLKDGTRGSRDDTLTPQQRKALAVVIGKPTNARTSPAKKNTSQFRNQAAANPDQTSRGTLGERPLNYVTITRTRPPASRPAEDIEDSREEAEETDSEEANIRESTSNRAISTSSKYVTLNRNRGSPQSPSTPESFESPSETISKEPLPAPRPNRLRPTAPNRTPSVSSTTEEEVKTTTRPSPARPNVLNRLRNTSTARTAITATTTRTEVAEVVETKEPRPVDNAASGSTQEGFSVEDGDYTEDDLTFSANVALARPATTTSTWTHFRPFYNVDFGHDHNTLFRSDVMDVPFSGHLLFTHDHDRDLNDTTLHTLTSGVRQQPLEEKSTIRGEVIIDEPSFPETTPLALPTPAPLTKGESEGTEGSEEIEEIVEVIEEVQEESILPIPPKVSTTTTTTTRTTLAPTVAPVTPSRAAQFIPTNRFNPSLTSQATLPKTPPSRKFSAPITPSSTTTPPPPRSRPSTIPRRPRPPPVSRPVNAPNDEFFKIGNLDIQDGLLGGSQVVSGAVGDVSNANGDKVEIEDDGSIICFDTGTFAYPEDCKQFISCSSGGKGAIRGWLYTCPNNLSFDPVGGICNWGSPLRCKVR